jgi:hypothetical protein
MTKARKIRLGLMRGKIKIADDFNAPLDPLTFTDHTQATTAAESVTLHEALQRVPEISPEEADRFKTDIRELREFFQTAAVSRSVPLLVELTDGTRTISVGVSDRAQFTERFVRAWHGEHVGEAVTFATEALLRQALGPDLTAPETFEWVRQFMDDEIPYERFIAGRDAMR